MLHLWLATGGTILHSGICVLNDILDRDLDAKVERTKNRPLVTGAVSVSNASVFCAVLLAIPIYMLSYTNPTAFKWGIPGVFPFHGLYPLMKRVTYWPQAWLGFAMNWGLVVGYLTVSGGQWDSQILTLLTGTIGWSILYDTMYAYQDVKDDVKVGIKSTAILFGPNHGRKILTGFASAFLATLYFAGVQNGQGFYYFLFSVGGAGLHLAWQLWTWKQDNWDDCWSKLASNGDLGTLVWLGLFFDYCVKMA
ncbi:hypothetical protein PM082_007331 [Marasmius tenuissimus]|nr:hypothetical protein PM082_007331 [Marasmius tenuissimus]